MLSYYSVLKFCHINKCLSLKGFNNLWIVFIIKDKGRLFFSKKQNRLPITKNILVKITEEDHFFILDLDIDIIFKMAWAGFMKIEKLTYTIAEVKKTTFGTHNIRHLLCKKRFIRYLMPRAK